VVPGPTFTNVNDFRALLVRQAPRLQVRRVPADLHRSLPLAVGDRGVDGLRHPADSPQRMPLSRPAFAAGPGQPQQVGLAGVQWGVVVEQVDRQRFGPVIGAGHVVEAELQLRVASGVGRLLRGDRAPGILDARTPAFVFQFGDDGCHAGSEGGEELFQPVGVALAAGRFVHRCGPHRAGRDENPAWQGRRLGTSPTDVRPRRRPSGQARC
jgi:hypothetical protein